MTDSKYWIEIMRYSGKWGIVKKFEGGVSTAGGGDTEDPRVALEWVEELRSQGIPVGEHCRHHYDQLKRLVH